MAGVAGSLQGRIQGIAGQISGLINSVSLPNIPGVSQLRAAAGRLVGRAAGAVTAGLGQVRSLIGSALQAGLQALNSALAAAGRLATAALSHLAAAIQRAVRALLQTLARVASTVLGALRRLVGATVIPMLSRLQARLLEAVGRAHRQALAAIRTNRDHHLEALASAMDPNRQAGDAAPTGDPASVLRGIGQEAQQNNRLIVQAFSLRLGNVLGSIFGALAGGVARLIQHVAGVIAQAASAVVTKLQEVMQGLREVATRVAGFLQSVLSELGAGLGRLVQSVRTAVQRPADHLIQSASGALSRATQFVGRFVRNLLSGNLSVPSLGDFSPLIQSGGPITKPKPGPITLPALSFLFLILVAAGALVLYAVPQLLVVVAALVALGLSQAAAVAVLGLAAIALLLLLLYILYRLLKSKPKMPKPTITHLTDFAAPDGSPKTRTDVAVGERVVFTGSASGTWKATKGSPRRGKGPSFAWTAPKRKATAKITLDVGGSTASVTLRVLEPNSITGIKLRELSFPAGTQGAGMMLDFQFGPLNVSLGNAESREVSGPASAIKGYYRKHGMPHDHNAGPKVFFRITQGNQFAGGVQDQASQQGFPPPWDAGSFHWKIPNRFRVAGESGDGKKYTTVTQEFTMADATGRTKITKAGEQVERTP